MLRQFEGECLHVDDVDIGFLANLDDPAIGEAEKRCGVEGLLAHHVLERELRATVAVACPVGQQECRVGGIADQPAVGAAVGQTRHGGGVRQHLVDGVVVAGGVVVERQHQQRRGVGFEHQVVHRGQRVLAAALRRWQRPSARSSVRSRAGRRSRRCGRRCAGSARTSRRTTEVAAAEGHPRTGSSRALPGRPGVAPIPRDPVPPSACGRWVGA